MRLFISFLTVILCSIVVGNTAQQRMEVHGKGFPLNRQIVVVAAEYDNDVSQKITNILDAKGVKYITSHSSKTSKPKIVLSRVVKVDGVEQMNAYYIKVTQKKVLIQYTTQVSLDKAIEYFEDLVRENEKILPGQTVYDWGESKIKKGVINAASVYLSAQEVDEILRYQKKSNVMFCMVKGGNWRLESEVFGVVNPDVSVYVPGEYYTFGQVVQMMQKHPRLIPMIDLMEESSLFTEVTGHSQFSVEGMRFVRAILEEFVTKSGLKRLCVGSRHVKVEARYMDFVEEMGRRLGVELLWVD